MKNIKDKNSMNLFKSATLRIQAGFIFCLLSSLFFGPGNLFAQQLPFSSQYYTNPFVINPAYTGINEKINVFVTHRSQWTGLAGAPQTSYFTIDGPIQAKNSSLGLKVYSDVTDIISRAGIFGNYSYKLKISDSNNLYIGVACGVFNNKIDFSKALIRDADDPFLSQQSQNKTVFSADLGVVYVWKKLTVGFAVPQILGNRIKYPNLNGDNSYYNLSPHYQGSAKYVFDLSKEKEITAYPLIMFRSVKGAPFQYDINGVVDWKSTGWVGLTYHSNYAVAVSAGIRFHNFCFGYAYDMGISKIKSYTGSSSEFLLGYTFGQKKKEQDRFVKVEDPRVNIAALAGNANIDTSQALISKMKADADYNQALLARSKAVSDSNQAEIDRLKAELEKAKALAVTTPLNNAEGKPTAYISIRLVDEKGNALSDVQIEVIDKALDKVVAKPLINNDGYSRISLPSGKTYDIVITKSGYLFKSINIDIPDGVGYEKKLDDITLQKVEAGNKIVMNNISFDLNQSKLRKESYSELKNAVKLMKDIPSLEMEISGFTDNKGSVQLNQQLSKQRAKSVMDYLISQGCDKNRLTYKGYGSSQPIASNTTKEGRQLNRRTEFKVLKVGSEYTIDQGTNLPRTTESAEKEKVSSDVSIQKLEVGKTIVVDRISFEINQTKLLKESLLELDNTIKLLNDIPSLEIEISGHTDNLGSAKNNQQLSEQRAKSVMDYLISKGSDKNRLTYKGYGSSQPIAGNDTKDGRKTNRRIEIKVLKVEPGHTIPVKNPSNIEDSQKNLQPVPKKSKKVYRSKGHRAKNRVTIGGKP